MHACYLLCIPYLSAASKLRPTLCLPVISVCKAMQLHLNFLWVLQLFYIERQLKHYSHKAAFPLKQLVKYRKNVVLMPGGRRERFVLIANRRGNSL